MSSSLNHTGAGYAPLIHLSITASILFPLAMIIVPLVAYFVSSNRRVRAAGREVLNFAITMIFIPFILAGLYLSLVGIPAAVMMTLLLVPYIVLAFVVFPIVGAVKCADGVDYQYPLTIRFLRD
ncbi:MAG: hypothetical protein CMM87_04370 [Rickettsiales bacterium]|nr:hypothetical protein [Rickettsiales bacterium]|tara:strand:- start:5063 stop:5434 length:372 start_codon:yes stop_codon:yes gene_type:complete